MDGIERCEPTWVAERIGLSDASLIGVEPIDLTREGARKLREHGARAELKPRDAGAVLRVGAAAILNYIKPGRLPRLGHRYQSPRVLFISGADLAAFIEQRAKPPVPTTGRAPKPDHAATRRAVADARARHNLPAA